jgi:hypothetical protein
MSVHFVFILFIIVTIPIAMKAHRMLRRIVKSGDSADDIFMKMHCHSLRLMPFVIFTGYFIYLFLSVK